MMRSESNRVDNRFSHHDHERDDGEHAFNIRDEIGRVR